MFLLADLRCMNIWDNTSDLLLVFFQAEMIGTYLAEYSITYKPVKHGRPGIGATASSKFVPLK